MNSSFSILSPHLNSRGTASGPDSVYPPPLQKSCQTLLGLSRHGLFFTRRLQRGFFAALGTPFLFDDEGDNFVEKDALHGTDFIGHRYGTDFIGHRFPTVVSIKFPINALRCD